MKKYINRKFLLSFVAALTVIVTLFSNSLRKHNPKHWEFQIKSIEDRLREFPKNGIFFYGSSSIRKWSNLKKDFKPLPVFNAGFGGSILPDLTYFVPRLLGKIKPMAIVVYAGDNDLYSARLNLSAKDTLNNFTVLVKKIREFTPPGSSIKIFFISVKPSPARKISWEKMKKANALIEEWVSKTENVFYIDTASSMLNKDGTFRKELFLPDGLHLNQKGYELWTKIIQASFKESL
ncbi:MAG: GDSL-type esterase/lipase family protein [Leptospirales bacterium]